MSLPGVQRGGHVPAPLLDPLRLGRGREVQRVAEAHLRAHHEDPLVAVGLAGAASDDRRPLAGRLLHDAIDPDGRGHVVERDLLRDDRQGAGQRRDDPRRRPVLGQRGRIERDADDLVDVQWQHVIEWDLRAQPAVHGRVAVHGNRLPQARDRAARPDGALDVRGGEGHGDVGTLAVEADVPDKGLPPVRDLGQERRDPPLDHGEQRAIVRDRLQPPADQHPRHARLAEPPVDRGLARLHNQLLQQLRSSCHGEGDGEGSGTHARAGHRLRVVQQPARLELGESARVVADFCAAAG